MRPRDVAQAIRQRRAMTPSILAAIRRKQPVGPWWCILMEDDSPLSVHCFEALDQYFIDWLFDHQVAGLGVDSVTEAYAKTFLRMAGNEGLIAKKPPPGYIP